mgnify:CR=1 FL=1
MEGGGDVEIDCSDRSLMRKWDRDRWYSNIDAVLDARRRHANGEMTQTELNKRIKAAGYCPTPNGLLADRELRAVIDCFTAYKYDWMHVAVQDGFVSNAMWLVVQAGLDDIEQGKPLVDFIKSFEFPFSRRSTDRYALPRVFSKKMMRKHSNAGTIIANASVQLSLYRMLEFWAIEKSSPEMDPHNEVFFASCYVVNLFREVKYRRMETRTAAELLLPAIERWQSLHKALYGSQYFKPKFNWIWSVAEQLAASPRMFDMFCVERQHRRVKRQAELVCSTTDFERSCLMRALDVLTQRFKVILDSEQTIARGGDVKPTAVWATNAHLELIPAAEIDLSGAEEKRSAVRAEKTKMSVFASAGKR